MWIARLCLAGLFSLNSSCATELAWRTGPEAVAVDLAKEIPNTNGIGNCIEHAHALQARFGGEVRYLEHPRLLYGHAVLLMPDGTVYDNGFLGYRSTWTELIGDGWRFQ